MAYTFGGFKKKAVTAPTNNTSSVLSSNFGNLQTDGQRTAMTGVLGNWMQSYDATTVPVYSPITNGSGSGFALTVPQGAAQITLYIASAVTAIVGEDSTYTYGLFIPTATLVTLDCANQQFIYIKPSSGTNTIYFQFKMV
jgi:hypothetical protein